MFCCFINDSHCKTQESHLPPKECLVPLPCQTNNDCSFMLMSTCRYFTFLTECKEPKACTILLRGASKDVLNEVERNLQDAMCVARNVMMDAHLCPGGGAVEMEVAHVSISLLNSI